MSEVKDSTLKGVTKLRTVATEYHIIAGGDEVVMQEVGTDGFRKVSVEEALLCKSCGCKREPVTDAAPVRRTRGPARNAPVEGSSLAQGASDGNGVPSPIPARRNRALGPAGVPAEERVG